MSSFPAQMPAFLVPCLTNSNCLRSLKFQSLLPKSDNTAVHCLFELYFPVPWVRRSSRAEMWESGEIILNIALLSRITVLGCLLSSGLKQLFYAFCPNLSFLWYKNKSSAHYSVMVGIRISLCASLMFPQYMFGELINIQHISICIPSNGIYIIC